MNILITSSRFPVALDLIRKLARGGQRILAADTFRTAPGSHSRFVTASLRVAPPEYEPERFLSDIKQILFTRRIDLLVPAFEEVFYLARHADELRERVQLFAPSFEVLARLHDKAAFNALARELRLPAPPTRRVTTQDDLADAILEHPSYFARPEYSRGGLELFTNRGPLAGALTLDACRPTEDRPWVVQPYLHGTDVCSFSVAQHGRVVAHCAYVHPREIEHAGGIVFESIDEPETLAFTERIVEATGYHGQLGLDFRRTGHGLFLIECNARPTAGIHLVPKEMLVQAIVGPAPATVQVVPPGRRRMYAMAVVRDLLRHRTHAREDLSYLFSGAGDVYGDRDDMLPAIFQVLSYGRVFGFLRHKKVPRRGTALVAAYFDGVSWDGRRIP
jgi:hypothetical protein